MRKSGWFATMVSVLGCASSAFAASGAEYEGNSLLISLFIGLGALVVAFQFIPGLVLLGSMVKGIFSAPAQEAPATVNGGKK